MKNLLASILIYTGLTSGVYFSQTMQIQWLENISMFGLWFLIVCSFIALFGESKEIFKNKYEYPFVKNLLSAIMVVFVVGFGWTITAIFYVVGWILLHAKRAVYLDSLKTNS